MLRAAFAAMALLTAPAAAAEPFDVAARYVKSEHLVPMRDGVGLFTAVYRPRQSAAKQPILLLRTPYSIEHYGADDYHEAGDLSPDEALLDEGYIFVLQDARGTNRSEGDWVDFRPLAQLRSRRDTDETTDNWDTIEWLVRNVPGNNGRVGQWGISYPAWYAVMGMLKPHPALKAVSPQATTADPFIGDDFHLNGAFIPTGLMWTEGLTLKDEARRAPDAPPPQPIDYGTAWSYDFFLHAGPAADFNRKYFDGRLIRFWDDMVEHADYDAYWQQRNFLRPLVDITVPVLNVAGWFDEFDLYGAFETYRAIERNNPGNRSVLVAGPWRHGGWHEEDGDRLGDMQFGSKTSEYYRKRLVVPFFRHYLKDQGEWPPAEAVVFETGANRWHALDQWPPRGVTPRKLYLRADGRLSFEAPDDPPGACDSYLSDPSRPVPYTTEISMEEGYLWTVADQRYAYTRPDVRSWQTDVLTEDVTIAGPIPVELFAATSGTDSDWFVKLIDVHPYAAGREKDGPEMRGYQMMLGFGVMRGKYREDFSSPKPMTPGEPTRIAFNIWDKFHTFRKGHRIMVQVQSSMFPFFDRNPQTFTNIYRAGPEAYQAATQRICRSRDLPSHLALPVVR